MITNSPPSLGDAFLRWIDRKVAVAEHLATGGGGASYVEAYLVLSCSLSSIAADLWPGDGIDKNRFVELWHRYSGSNDANVVSVPLLIEELDATKHQSELQALRATNPRAFAGRGIPNTMVVTASDVDKPVAEVEALCPTLTPSQVRRFSYPAVFYTHVRSSVVHELEVEGSATGFSWFDASVGVSYANCVQPPHRRIHFSTSWLSGLLRNIAANVVQDWVHRPISLPGAWWLQG
jgi:hypothetical protein